MTLGACACGNSPPARRLAPGREARDERRFREALDPDEQELAVAVS